MGIGKEVHDYLDELSGGNIYGKVTLCFERGRIVSTKEELTWKAAELKEAYPERRIIRVQKADAGK